MTVTTIADVSTFNQSTTSGNPFNEILKATPHYLAIKDVFDGQQQYDRSGGHNHDLMKRLRSMRMSIYRNHIADICQLILGVGKRVKEYKNWISSAEGTGVKSAASTAANHADNIYAVDREGLKTILDVFTTAMKHAKWLRYSYGAAACCFLLHHVTGYDKLLICARCSSAAVVVVTAVAGYLFGIKNTGTLSAFFLKKKQS